MPNKKSKSKSKSKYDKNKQLFHLDKGVLHKYGYENVKDKTTRERRIALNKALANGIKPLSLFRRINALYVLNKNQDPKLAMIFKKDRDFIKTTSAYKKREKPKE